MSDKELEQLRALLSGGNRQAVVSALAKYLQEVRREEQERELTRKLGS